MFGIFKKNKKTKPLDDFESYAQELGEYFKRKDFLGKAAEAKHKAKSALKNKEFDKAWGYFHEQKKFYMQHANRSGFTQRQALALDSSVHEDLANILRIENKHEDALIHILYWVIAKNDQPIKRHLQKLTAYFNRCKFKNTTLQNAIDFVSDESTTPDFMTARSKVAEWKSLEQSLLKDEVSGYDR